VIYTCNPSTQESETGSQPELCSKGGKNTLGISKEKKKDTLKKK
jgi:hypothetical protein